ncbi:MAG: hypothetical protein ABUT20_33015 [Bacteroidota bacterium]
MYLAAGIFSIFKEYVSILVFICLPVVVLSVALAVWLHFRQQKRKSITDLSANDPKDISDALPDVSSHSVAISPLAPEEKIGLIRECRKQLRKSRAKFLALKSDFTSVLKNIAGNSIPENDSHMENLNEKIAAYEKQIAALQNKLEVLATVAPVQDERYYLQQSIKEKDEEIKELKAAVEKSGRTIFAPVDEAIVNQEDINSVFHHEVQELKLENTYLNNKIREQEEELARNRQLLENIYKELETTSANRKREIAEQPLS